MSIESHEQPTSYLSTKLIRRGGPFDPARPTTNDLFRPTDLTSLDLPSLLDFRSAVKTFDKLERLRRDEKAKVCHLLISSFSEEAKMLLRSVLAFVTVFNDNDSFAMYCIAKDNHTCTSSFAVAQSTFHQLLSIKMTGTFAALTDALLNHRRTFAAIFDSTATGNMHQTPSFKS